MTEPFRIKYYLCQYIPNCWRHEASNVGIILTKGSQIVARSYAEDPEKLGTVISKLARKRVVHPNIFARWINYWREELAAGNDGLQKLLRDEQINYRVIPAGEVDNVGRDSLKTVTENLFQELVEPRNDERRGLAYLLKTWTKDESSEKPPPGNEPTEAEPGQIILESGSMPNPPESNGGQIIQQASTKSIPMTDKMCEQCGGGGVIECPDCDGRGCEKCGLDLNLLDGEINCPGCHGECVIDDGKPTFKLIEFNPRRFARGKEAARVECDGNWLWMSRKHIQDNIKEFGHHPELIKALEAYKTPGKEFKLTTDN